MKQQEHGPGDHIVIPNSKVNFVFVKILSPVDLKRAKKSFLTYCKMKPPAKEVFADSYIEYLNATMTE